MALTLLSALDFNQIVEPLGMVQDATQQKYFANARYWRRSNWKMGSLNF